MSSSDENYESADEAENTQNLESNNKKLSKTIHNKKDTACQLETNANESMRNEKQKQFHVENMEIDRGKDTEEVEGIRCAMDRLASEDKPSWSTWGSKLYSAASTTVGTFTDAVEGSITTIKNTTETALRSSNSEVEKEKISEIDVNLEKRDEKNDSWANWGISGFTSAFGKATNVIESTSKNVVSSSLNVLETIGKKTYETIAEGEHGLKSTLKKNRINLSQILREAKENVDVQTANTAAFKEEQSMNYSSQFDEYNGLVNLEALEMLSYQSHSQYEKLRSVSEENILQEIENDLKEIQDIFETFNQENIIDDNNDDIIANDHDFALLFVDYANFINQLGLSLGEEASNLLKTQNDIRNRITENDVIESKELYKISIASLAELTARTVIYYHKIAQKLLSSSIKKEMSSFKKASNNLYLMSKLIDLEFTIISDKFTKALNVCINEDSATNTYITSVYFEGSNSGRYVKEAFQLLHPIFQLSITKEMSI